MISVIIPCFNKEKYVAKCLESIMANDYDSYEIICINDGSTDNTLDVLKQYSNITIIDQENHGVSYARNVGIDKANGEYITFVDADDTVTNDYFKELDKVIDCCYDVIQFNENNYFSASVWSKCIKKQFLLDNRIKFKTSLKFGEDLNFSNKILMKTSNIYYMNKKIYNYELNDSSVSNDISKRSDIFDSLLDLIQYRNENHLVYDLSEKIYNHGFVYYIADILNYGFNKSQIKIVFDKLELFKDELSDKQKNKLLILFKAIILKTKLDIRRVIYGG